MAKHLGKGLAMRILIRRVGQSFGVFMDGDLVRTGFLSRRDAQAFVDEMVSNHVMLMSHMMAIFAQDLRS